MLAPEQRSELARLTGEVVLRFARLEASTVRLAQAAFSESRLPQALKRLPFSAV
jgi:hypothetical protein